MITSLARVPFARITRSPVALVAIGAWTLLVLAVAIVSRQQSSGHAGSGVLIRSFGGIALPFLALGIATAVTKGETLAHSGRALVALGAGPRRVAAASVSTAIVTTAVAAMVLGSAVLLIGGTDRPVGEDLLTTAWVSGLSGAAYASFFSLGSTWRWGRGAFFLVDAVVGGIGALSAVLLPRAHVRSLLGGLPANDLPQHWSIVGLVVLTVVCTALAIRRGRA